MERITSTAMGATTAPGQLSAAESALAALVEALAGLGGQPLDAPGRVALASARAAALRLADATQLPPKPQALPGEGAVPGAGCGRMPVLTGHRVLLAAPAAPAALSAALRAAGALVFRAPSAAAALAWLEIATCDLVLLGHDLDGRAAAPAAGGEGDFASALRPGAHQDADAAPGMGAVRVLAAIRGQSGAPGRAPVLGLGTWPVARRGGADRLDAVVALPSPEAVAEALHRVLAEADAALAGLGASTEPVVDPERYNRLIDMAGEEAAQELLARLAEDLEVAARGLARALDGGGGASAAAEIRAHTHVLVALAGAVGATALQRLAEALNAAAHRGAPAEMARLGAATQDRLGALIAFVSDQGDGGADAGAGGAGPGGGGTPPPGASSA